MADHLVLSKHSLLSTVNVEWQTCIALEGALVEVVAGPQDSLQQVDEAPAGMHLLAAKLQHLQLLPHLPHQLKLVHHSEDRALCPTYYCTVPCA